MNELLIGLLMICMAALFFCIALITYVIYKKEIKQDQQPVIIQQPAPKQDLEQSQKVFDEAYTDKGFEEFINSLDAYLTDKPEEEVK